MIDFSEFYRELVEASYDLPQEFLEEERAKKYYIHLSELESRGRDFNLTSITDPSEAINKHVVDALFAAQCVRAISGEEKISLLDVGSGGGFPALPIAIACENVSVTALDATSKKCAFIFDTAKKSGVTIDTLPERAEEAALLRRENFDIVTARAVARLNTLVELCAAFVKVGGHFLAMKGASALEERDEASSAADKLGITLEDVARYSIKGGDDRYILIYRKTSLTPEKYPRKFAQIKKHPL